MPKHVVVMGRKIPVKLVGQDILDKMIEGAIGLYDCHTRCIYINKTLPKHIQKYTLDHELGHVIMDLTGLDQVIHRQIQEIICQSYATLMEDIKKMR
jgi:Zn-dependent peptidase ImmA (M78 family)